MPLQTVSGDFFDLRHADAGAVGISHADDLRTDAPPTYNFSLSCLVFHCHHGLALSKAGRAL